VIRQVLWQVRATAPHRHPASRRWPTASRICLGFFWSSKPCFTSKQPLLFWRTQGSGVIRLPIRCMHQLISAERVATASTAVVLVAVGNTRALWGWECLLLLLWSFVVRERFEITSWVRRLIPRSGPDLLRRNSAPPRSFPWAHALAVTVTMTINRWHSPSPRCVLCRGS